jgi:hypothetical protein
LSALNHVHCVELAGLPDEIRGYDHVKFANLDRYRDRVAKIQARLSQPERLAA